MDQLFYETIENWDDWGRVYQSIPAFTPLVEEICRREGLPFVPLASLTPGTNAVFRVGDLVVKVFFPKESGLDPEIDFSNEAAVCGFLTDRWVSVPPLLAKGHIDDQYRFYYLITRYFPGREAGDWLAEAGNEEKTRFAEAVRRLLSEINLPADGLIPPVDLLERAVTNFRLEKLPASLREDMRRRAENLDLSQRVLVHGDLTGENLLVGEDGRPMLIDCADACLAPAWYEYGPLVFELFRCDPVPLRVLAGGAPEEFVERTLDAVCIHDFGADLLRVAAEREEIPIFPHLENVRQFLLERLAVR